MNHRFEKNFLTEFLKRILGSVFFLIELFISNFWVECFDRIFFKEFFNWNFHRILSEKLLNRNAESNFWMEFLEYIFWNIFLNDFYDQVFYQICCIELIPFIIFFNRIFYPIFELNFLIGIVETIFLSNFWIDFIGSKFLYWIL